MASAHELWCLSFLLKVIYSVPWQIVLSTYTLGELVVWTLNGLLRRNYLTDNMLHIQILADSTEQRGVTSIRLWSLQKKLRAERQACPAASSASHSTSEKHRHMQPKSHCKQFHHNPQGHSRTLKKKKCSLGSLWHLRWSFITHNTDKMQ